MMNNTRYRLYKGEEATCLQFHSTLVRNVRAWILLLVLLTTVLPPRSTFAQEPPGFVVELSRLRVVKENENDDEPYFIVIGFRSRYRTPDSTQTSWSGALYELDESEGFIPPDMGRVAFPNVELFTLEDLAYGKFPEVLGALVLAMESDGCTWGTVRAAMNTAKDVFHAKLVELIEQGGINPDNLNLDVLKEIPDEIENKALSAAKDAAISSLDLGCLVDPEEFIDYHLFLYSPIEPEIGSHIPASDNSKISWGAVDNRANQIHEFEISAGNPIVFEGAGARYETTVIIRAEPAVSSRLLDCATSIQTISKAFLPFVIQTQGQGTVTYTQTPLQTLQYNVQFLTPWSDSALPGHWPNTDERATAIGQALACFDIVALNEVLNDDRRQTIFQVMNQNAPHCGKPSQLADGSHFAMVDGPDVPNMEIKNLQDFLDAIVAVRKKPIGQQGQPILGDELAIISRLPIVETNSHIYNARAGEDTLAAKGVLHARLRNGLGSTDYLDVFTTHLQAGHEDAKRCQIEELAQFMADHTEPGVPVLLFGDFNVNGALDKQNDPGYLYLQNTLGLLHSGHTLEDLGQLLPKGTNQSDDPAKHRAERIDYIFGSPTGLLLSDAQLEIKEFDGNGWGTLSDHAGVVGNLVWQQPRFTPLPSRPDLVVDDIRISSEGVRLTIRNIGNAPVLPGDNFWVDLYIAPRTPPTSVNQVWQDMGDAGLAWIVVSEAFPLPPGAQIILDLNDPYFDATNSLYPEEILAGSQIFAQVDSANMHFGYGSVLEGHEETGQSYNNILAVTVPETISTVQWRPEVANAASDADVQATIDAAILATPRHK